jgi:hypothetical protein
MSSTRSLLKGDDDWLREDCDRMTLTLPIKDHRSGFSIYKNSFSGESYASWMRGSSCASSVEQALEYGNKIISMGLIKCLNDKSNTMVDDSNRFYRFMKDENSSVIEENEHEVLDVNITFQELLQHPRGIIMFEEFCKKEYNSENLHFWSAVVDYRDKFEEFDIVINEAANQIMDHYIAIGAKEGLNIPATIREGCLLRYQTSGATPDLFDKPAEEIHGLMKKDTFRRFMEKEIVGKKKT